MYGKKTFTIRGEHFEDYTGTIYDRWFDFTFVEAYLSKVYYSEVIKNVYHCVSGGLRQRLSRQYADMPDYIVGAGKSETLNKFPFFVNFKIEYHFP